MPAAIESFDQFKELVRASFPSLWPTVHPRSFAVGRLALLTDPSGQHGGSSTTDDGFHLLHQINAEKPIIIDFCACSPSCRRLRQAAS